MSVHLKVIAAVLIVLLLALLSGSAAGKKVKKAEQIPLTPYQLRYATIGIPDGVEAESIAPSILWLDEMEKGFSGLSSSGQTDGGTTARVFGTFLTWLQEKKSPVFVVATCNNVKELPPELLRKGRFDEIFFVDLPAKEERKDIFRIHLEKRHRAPNGFDLEKLAESTKEFAGSELEEIIVSALYDAFDEGCDLKQEHLEKTVAGMIPLSKTMGDQIKGIREWAKIRAKKASNSSWEDEAAGVRKLEM